MTLCLIIAADKFNIFNCPLDILIYDNPTILMVFQQFLFNWF